MACPTRVDEIDLTAGVAIERTLLPLQEAVLYKDIQLVVAALLLRSLPAAGIPQKWAAIRQIRRFVLETPDGSVEVRPSNEHFDAIHEAATIIRDLAGSHLAEWPIWQLAQCTPVNSHTVCSHPFMRCFFRVPTYPQSRAPIKREVRRLCRAQLYELLWQRDLGKYRLYMQGAAEESFPALPIEFLGTARDEDGPYIEARLQRGNPPDFFRCADHHRDAFCWCPAISGSIPRDSGYRHATSLLQPPRAASPEHGHSLARS